MEPEACTDVCFAKSKPSTMNFLIEKSTRTIEQPIRWGSNQHSWIIGLSRKQAGAYCRKVIWNCYPNCLLGDIKDVQSMPRQKLKVDDTSSGKQHESRIGSRDQWTPNRLVRKCCEQTARNWCCNRQQEMARAESKPKGQPEAGFKP